MGQSWSGRVPEGGRLQNVTGAIRGPRGRKQVCISPQSHFLVPRSGRLHLLRRVMFRERGEFVDDYVRLGMLDNVQYRCGIERVCDYLTGPCRLARAGGFAGANQGEDLVSRIVKTTQQRLTNRARGSGDQNFHSSILSWRA